MPDNNEQERPSKDIEFSHDSKSGKTAYKMGTADFLALAALVVAIIIAIGMVMGKIEGKIGLGILTALCGGAAIAKVAGSRARSRKGKKGPD
jgi:hypothetical protein